MKKNQPSIDGFIPRRPGSQLGELHSMKNVEKAVKPIDRSLHTGDNIGAEAIGTPRVGKQLGQDEIDASLREIDDIEAPVKDRKTRRREKHALRKAERASHKTRRIIKWVLISLVIIALMVGGYVFFKAMFAGQNVFNGSIFDIVQSEPLKEDKYGRSNFLIVGTSEDDPGHEASYLTDSIMVLSLNQKEKNIYMFSIPRDLYVEYGMACLPGYRGKINSYFDCSNSGKKDADEQDRLRKTQKFIGDIVGMDIQYGVHVNYTVMRDVVKAIGNEITVKIESRHPNGQMDSNFDWKCGGTYAERLKNCPPNGHFIDYPNGEVKLDAEHALYLAQARGDRAPTYGFEQSNFDRERNQQKIIVAIRDKALSAGTLTNVGAVTGLVDALGKNLRTNIQTKEIRTLIDLARDIPNESIQSIDLNKQGEAVFTTRTIPAAGSVVLPAAGMFQYDQIRAYLKKHIYATPVEKEEANVIVLNASGVGGVAQVQADRLGALGFVIARVDNAPKGEYGDATIYMLDDSKTASAAKLQELYGVAPVTTTPPVSVTGETDFVVVIGKAPAE